MPAPRGISLGKANYCLKALMNKGLVKAKNFKNSANKRAYLYILTPKGIETKARIDALGKCEDSTLKVSSEELEQTKKLHFTTNTSELAEANVFIVTMSTPINRHKQPDLAPLKKASHYVFCLPVTLLLWARCWVSSSIPLPRT